MFRFNRIITQVKKNKTTVSQSLHKSEKKVAKDSDDSLIGCTPPKVKSVRMENDMNNVHLSDVNSSTDADWCGVPLKDLKTSNLKELFPCIKPSDSHTVLFKVPIVPGNIPTPYPAIPIDVWDQDHVRLPHSKQSLSPISETELRRRWDLVREAFSAPIRSSQDLQAAIFHYNSKYADKWTFKNLHYFFDTVLEEEETDYFFENVLPGIISLALSLPKLITGAIPLLRQRKTHSISLTQKQIACLLANAFLCTYPRRNTTKADSEYKNYPDINFNRLFTFDARESSYEKLKCIINYFRRVCSDCPEGVVTFSRHYVRTNNLPVWRESDSLIPPLHVSSSGTIENEGAGMMELDFANKRVGGGVLGRGCVQEEIRFVICPELIIARLFTESLDDTEALIITGIERFNDYKGYASSFTWTGDIKDETLRDNYGRRMCVLVAIDAIKFQQADKQYLPENINRELNKAYAGFAWGKPAQGKKADMNIATGNWGCGAYRGNTQLKSLLQLMAAGEVGRSVAYFTFNDPELRDKLNEMHKFLVENKITIGRLWRVLSWFHCRDVKKSDLFTYLYKRINNQEKVVPEVSLKTQVKVEQNSMDVEDSENFSGLSTVEIDAAMADFANEDFVELKHKQSTSASAKQEDLGGCNSKGEPIKAKSYNVTLKEGRDLCLKKQRDSWARIEESKKDFTEFDIVDDDSMSDCADVGKTKIGGDSEVSTTKQSATIVKKKISDYFSTIPKT